MSLCLSLSLPLYRLGCGVTDPTGFVVGIGTVVFCDDDVVDTLDVAGLVVPDAVVGAEVVVGEGVAVVGGGEVVVGAGVVVAIARERERERVISIHFLFSLSLCFSVSLSSG